MRPLLLEVQQSSTPSILQQHLLEVTQVPMSISSLTLEMQSSVHHFTSLSFLFTPTSSSLVRSVQLRIQSRHHSSLVLGTRHVSAIIPTRSRKFWRKNEHISNDRNNITMQATRSTSRNSSSSCSTSRTLPFRFRSRRFSLSSSTPQRSRTQAEELQHGATIACSTFVTCV
jgi:hypothetical protein